MYIIFSWTCLVKADTHFLGQLSKLNFLLTLKQKAARLGATSILILDGYNRLHHIHIIGHFVARTLVFLWFFNHGYFGGND